MDERTLRVLEFEKIRQMLAEATATALGRELAEALLPSTDLREVELRQAETTEATALLRGGPGFSLGGVRDVRIQVRRATLGAPLEPFELLDVASTAVAARRLSRFVMEHSEVAPNLAAQAAQLGVFDELAEEVRRCISDEAQVLDRASPALGDLRRRTRQTQSRIKDRLDTMIKSSSLRSYLQEALVTVRDHRYVLPVKVEYRSQVPGIVHDQSASGSTLFIEPMAVVELNNELKKLAMEEQTEIQRILHELSALVGRDAVLWNETLSALAVLDFAAAKGLLAQRMSGNPPVLNRQGLVNLKQARHPLLTGSVVPIDVHLGRNFDILLITGPNTGGKTVTLKTVGLFCLMAQAGLHIPAAYGSALAVFPQVSADIGDEQSIEQSLSTFSSHMTAIVRLMNSLEPGALVLLDEVGAGTDPAEGAALARAILEHLHDRSARVIATTHYPDLKAYAATHPRVENASVEFDVETLRPTYRLLIGVPGASCALEISQRLGLKPELVKRSRDFLSQESESVEALLRQIQAMRNQVEDDRAAAVRDRSRAEEVRREGEQAILRARGREKEILGRAREQAEELLRLARSEAETVIRDLRSVLTEGRAQEQAQVIASARGRLQAARELAREMQPQVPPSPPPEGLRPGETVRIRSVDAVGYVVSGPDSSGGVVVQAGLMKLTAALADLERVSEAEARPARSSTGLPAGATGVAGLTRWGRDLHGGSGSGSGSGSGGGTGGTAGTGGAAARAAGFALELDLRGLMVAEAIEEVDKYLDDAVLAGAEQVRIIHGKGTGALRRAVQEFVRGHQAVASSRLGGTGEGGDGVTVARLKE